jgi:uncharacterized protein
VARDVTERRRAVRALAEAKLSAERLARARTEFMSIASHELRTPLTALQLRAEAASRAPGTADLATRLLGPLRRLTAIVDDLLAASRLEDGSIRLERARVDLRAIAARIVDEFRPVAGDRPLRLAEGPPVIAPLDAGRAGQILANLVENAVKYSPHRSPIDVRVWADGGCARVSIADHGPGIPPPERANLFTPFARLPGTRTIPGLGLGLHIARQFARMHRGAIALSDTPGGGATFIVSFPLAVEEADQPALAPAGGEVHPGPPRHARGADPSRYTDQHGGGAMADARWMPGMFVWRELMTDDVEGARRFYGELLGWSWKGEDMGTGHMYWLASKGDRQVGGLMAKPPGVTMPSAWGSYVLVDDVDAAAARGTAAGARLLKPPTDIPGVGRFAFLADPWGAVFQPFRGASEEPPPPAEMPPPGAFCWETLVTPDPAAAAAFYGKVIGFRTGKTPDGKGTTLTVGDMMVADLQAARPGGPSYWATYVHVEGAEVSRDRAAQLGAKVLVPRVDVPEVGTVAVIADPSGAALGLFQPRARL